VEHETTLIDVSEQHSTKSKRRTEITKSVRLCSRSSATPRRTRRCVASWWLTSSRSPAAEAAAQQHAVEEPYGAVYSADHVVSLQRCGGAMRSSATDLIRRHNASIDFLNADERIGELHRRGGKRRRRTCFPGHVTPILLNAASSTACGIRANSSVSNTACLGPVSVVFCAERTSHQQFPL